MNELNVVLCAVEITMEPETICFPSAVTALRNIAVLCIIVNIIIVLIVFAFKRKNFTMTGIVLAISYFVIHVIMESIYNFGQTVDFEGYDNSYYYKILCVILIVLVVQETAFIKYMIKSFKKDELYKDKEKEEENDRHRDC